MMRASMAELPLESSISLKEVFIQVSRFCGLRANRVGRLLYGSRAARCIISLMRLPGVLLLGCVGIALGATPDDNATTLIEKRCLGCHNSAQKMGALSLESWEAALRGGKSGPALNPDDALSSLIWKRVEAGQMPLGNPLPEAERTALRSWLSGGAKWSRVLAGAKRPRADKSWWSLQPVKVADPLVAGGAPGEWGRTPIDRYLATAMKAKGLLPSSPADRRTLVRRVTFDLTGLPPTPEEVEQFDRDARPQAYEELVDRLLASRAYGERWGRHWLDVARFGESHGYEQNHLRLNAWQYRDYVIRSFNEDKPFSQMVLEQLAGDVVGKGNPDVEVATAFLVAGAHDTVGNQAEAAKRQQRADDLDDMINATAAAFLGLTVNCARCHDHKFDPIQQADYYRMQALLSGVHHAEREIVTEQQRRDWETKVKPLEKELERTRARLKKIAEEAKDRADAARHDVLARYRPPVSPRLTEETFAPATARFVRLSARAGAPGGLDEIEVWTADGRNAAIASAGGSVRASSTRRPEASPEAYSEKNLNDGRYDQRWFADGSGPVHITVELPRAETVHRIAWSSDRMGGFMEKFEAPILREYAVEVSKDGAAWTRVADSKRRLPARNEDQEQIVLLSVLPAERNRQYRELQKRAGDLENRLKEAGKLPTVYAGQFRQPEEPAFLLKGGNVMARGEAVVPASLSTLDHVLDPFIVAEDAPESERRVALANWITHPKNPLTPRVLANRLWHYHFGRGLVGTPSDFGFNGEKPTHTELLDYLAARLLHYGWHMKPLHKEIVMSAAFRQSSAFSDAAANVDSESRYLWRFPPQRLSAEAIRDSLLSVAGVLKSGSGGPGFRLYRYTVDNVATYFPLESFGPETYRRSVYLQTARSIRPELLSQYDCPDSALPEPKRVVTTSPVQALALLNNGFVTDMAEAFAARVVREAGGERDAQIRRAFALAFVRPPNDWEMEAARRLVERHGLSAICRALFNANEFVYVM